MSNPIQRLSKVLDEQQVVDAMLSSNEILDDINYVYTTDDSETWEGHRSNIINPPVLSATIVTLRDLFAEPYLPWDTPQTLEEYQAECERECMDTRVELPLPELPQAAYDYLCSTAMPHGKKLIFGYRAQTLPGLSAHHTKLLRMN